MLSPDKVQEGHGVVWHAAALRPPGEVVLQHEPLRVSPLQLLPGGAALELRVTDLERPDRVVGQDVFSQLRYLNGTVALRIPIAGPVLGSAKWEVGGVDEACLEIFHCPNRWRCSR